MAARYLSFSLIVGLLAAIALLYWDDLEIVREGITSANRVRVKGGDTDNEVAQSTSEAKHVGVRGQNATESSVELVEPTSNKTDEVNVTSERVDDGDDQLHAESSRTQGSADEPNIDSPVCQPHFRAATNSSNPWSDQAKFKRIYFYHFRKAGGTNLRIYLGKVAAHHCVLQNRVLAAAERQQEFVAWHASYQRRSNAGQACLDGLKWLLLDTIQT